MERRAAASLEIEPGARRQAPRHLLLDPKGPQMLQILRARRAVALAVTAAAASASIAYAAGEGPVSADASGGSVASGGGNANIQLFAPKSGDRSGLGGTGFFIDLKADIGLPLQRSGFGGQGPATGIGKDKRFPGLIVLMSTTKAGAGKNLAGLFDIVGVTDREADKTQFWATWQAAKPNFGTGPSTVYVAVAGDRDGDGVLNDAPDTVADADDDGDVDEKDLKAAGASGVKAVDFVIDA
jgi:hypothetical protein